MAHSSHFRIGSRGSQLALWQANHIAEKLRSKGHMASIEIIRTTGCHAGPHFRTGWYEGHVHEGD